MQPYNQICQTHRSTSPSINWKITVLKQKQLIKYFTVSKMNNTEQRAFHKVHCSDRSHSDSITAAFASCNTLEFLMSVSNIFIKISKKS